MKVRKILILLLVCMCVFVSGVNAEDMVDLDIDIVRTQIILQTDDVIIGKLTVKNNTDKYFPDFYYSFRLLNERYNGVKSQRVGIASSEVKKTSIAKKQEKDIYFVYDIPKNIPHAIYNLEVEFSTRTMPLGSTSTIFMNLDLGKDDSKFVYDGSTDGNRFWIINKEEIRSDIGPTVSDKDKVEAKIELKSNYSEKIDVTPRICIYQRSREFDSYPILNEKITSINFSADEKKTVKIEVPVVSVPGSYLVIIEFLDEDDNIVSNEFSFRYVVGGEGGKILTTYIDEENNLDIFTIGSADGKTKVENAEVAFCITDGDNVESGNEKVSLSNSVNRISVPLSSFFGKKVDVSIMLKNDNKVFDEFNFSVNLGNLEQLDFYDVQSSLTKDAVQILSAKGVISGYPDGTFKPNNRISRAEMATIAVQLEGLEIIQGGNSVFSDVSNEHWAKERINVAQANGLISGYGNGQFGPSNNVTIAEAVTILSNLLGYKDEVSMSRLSWPLNYMTVAGEYGLIDSISYGSYNDPATREQVAILTLNALLLKYN